MDSHQPTLKRKILDILSDYRWHSMAEMARRCANGETIATSISQRIGDMKRRSIVFDERHFGSRHWEWKLLTKWEEIDLKTCSLKEPYSNEPAVKAQCSDLACSESITALSEGRQAGSKDSLKPPEAEYLTPQTQTSKISASSPFQTEICL